MTWSHWRPYWAILSARFRMLLQYRAAALAGLWTQIFFGLVLLMVYEAFYTSSTVRQPMAFVEVVSYIWLGQALLAMLPWNADADLRAMVRSGAVAYELCRPIDLYSRASFDNATPLQQAWRRPRCCCRSIDKAAQGRENDPDCPDRSRAAVRHGPTAPGAWARDQSRCQAIAVHPA